MRAIKLKIWQRFSLLKRVKLSNDQKHPTTRMTREQVLNELRREISMRERLYPNWVRTGKLKKGTADLRLNALKEALRIIEADTTKQGSLFDQPHN